MSRWLFALAAACGASRPSASTPDGTPIVSADALGTRLEGTADIPPDDVDRMALHLAATPAVTSAFTLCIDTAGRVISVDVTESTGLHSYDTKLRREIGKWRYSPFVVDGAAARVCSVARLVYRQPFEIGMEPGRSRIP